MTTKEASLGKQYGLTKRCMKLKCKCCRLICESPTYERNLGGKKITIRIARSTCTTPNTIYLFRCKLCIKPYVGKTTQQINSRTSEHRSCYWKVLAGNGEVKVDKEALDRFALGLHLYKDHGLRGKEDFDESFDLFILEVCSPRVLDIKEHMWIHKLKTLTPKGLNLGKTFGFPLLS